MQRGEGGDRGQKREGLEGWEEGYECTNVRVLYGDMSVPFDAYIWYTQCVPKSHVTYMFIALYQNVCIYVCVYVCRFMYAYTYVYYGT
jgi:hypothetical protein